MGNGRRRVVWVPEELDREVEVIRRRIGYTRSAFYRYALTRLLEQPLLSKKREIQLKPWEEIVGRLKAIETGNKKISAIINCIQDLEIALTYPKDTPEANAIQNLTKHLGQKIAILKTDNREKPLIVKTFNETLGNGIKLQNARPEILQKENQRKKPRKVNKKARDPIIDPNRYGLRLICGAFKMFWNFVKNRVLFGWYYNFVKISGLVMVMVVKLGQ